jgi:hypothetical protein
LTLAVLRHLGRNERILTTDGIVGETWTFLRRTDGHRTAVGFAAAGLVERGRDDSATA